MLVLAMEFSRGVSRGRARRRGRPWRSVRSCYARKGAELRTEARSR
jgi:hypothetical protein